MNRSVVLLLFLVFAASGGINAQNHSFAGDGLGPHDIYGRGCWGCHVPHGGITKTADGRVALPAQWGQDVEPVYEQILPAGELTPVVPPKASHDTYVGSGDPLVAGLLICLSCHDGKLAKGPMMVDQVYDLPGIHGVIIIPTVHEAVEGPHPFRHPVGENAVVACGGTRGWDCTYGEDGSVRMNGVRSTIFVTNYGWTVNQTLYKGKQIVVCTSCHNQHVMHIFKGNIAGVSGYYKTSFGVRGNYDPTLADDVNAITQFCRQCHADRANEMNNVEGILTKVTNQ